MKKAAEIREVLDTIRDEVNQGNTDAEIIWDTLRWVLDEPEVDDPAVTYVLGG